MSPLSIAHLQRRPLKPTPESVQPTPQPIDFNPPEAPTIDALPERPPEPIPEPVETPPVATDSRAYDRASANNTATPKKISFEDFKKLHSKPETPKPQVTSQPARKHSQTDGKSP